MTETIIELRDLSIGYGNKKVLQNINAKINKGEIVGIIGCNGAGKSTLLKTIRGLLSKQSGDILYFGRNLESFAEKELAREVAYLQQSVEVGFGYTGKDIVLAGRYPYMKWWKGESIADEELALKCMEYTGTRELAERPVNEVSGGQKQRISIARALLVNAEILILDDALSAVDGRTEHQILHNLRQWGQGRTVIISAHRLSALTEASEIIVMQHGHIGQRGNHDVLVQQSGWYRDMYRYQQLEAALDDAPEIREEAIDA